MTDNVQDIFDDLAVEYGRVAGRIGKSQHAGYHFSASKDGVHVVVGQRTFDRLRLLKRIDLQGVVIEPSVSERDSQAPGNDAVRRAGHDKRGGSADETEPSPGGEPSPLGSAER